MVAWVNNCGHEHVIKGESMGKVAFNMNISAWDGDGEEGGCSYRGCSVNHEIAHTAEHIWLM